ncbi:MAG: hypothetical protein JO089_04150 [Alphaproteobacteria bacterium]|nr:hypothetical protein [Alphaproteobacteria bacterium]
MVVFLLFWIVYNQLRPKNPALNALFALLSVLLYKLLLEGDFTLTGFARSISRMWHAI